MRMTYRQVRASYTPTKAAQERLDIMFRWFARPASFPVAWTLIRLGLSPNAVTLLSLGINLAGLALLGSGGQGLMLLGLALLLLGLVLDAADGNMARAMEVFSPLGEWLEGVGAYVLYASFHFLGGIGAYRSLTRPHAVVSLGTSPSGVVICGGVASISITLAVMLAAKFSIAFPSVGREQVVAKRGNGIYGALFTIGRNLSFPSGTVLPITFLGIALARYELVLQFFAVANAAMLLAVATRCAILGVRALPPHDDRG